MKNKFLKMTFMALCLSASSVVHGMNEEGDEGENRHAPALFNGEYEVGTARFLKQKNGSVTVHQFDKSRLALQVKLNDTLELRYSENGGENNLLPSLLKLGESNSLDNLVALFYDNKVSDSQLTRYYGEKIVDDCKMGFEFIIRDTPISLRAPKEKGFELWVWPESSSPNTGPSMSSFNDLPKVPVIQFSLFKKADDQTMVQELPHSLPMSPYSSSSGE